MPATVHLVTGGCRSGKSSYAQSICEKLSPTNPLIYLATSKVWDNEFAERVQRHKNDRGDRWTTIETPLHPSKHSDVFAGRVILVDCLTLWLTNHFMECGVFNEPDSNDNGNNDVETSSLNVDTLTKASDTALTNIKSEFNKLISQWDASFVFVTNEIGSGLHATTPASRKFVDAQGWLNQYVSSNADTVVYMVAGVPNIIKQCNLLAERKDPLKPPNEQELTERAMLDKFMSARKLDMDDKGYFLIKLDHNAGVIRATYHSCIKNDQNEICDINGKIIPCNGEAGPDPMATFEGRTAKELTVVIFEQWEHARELVSIGHAAYIGREAQKAEHCLFAGQFYQQD
jgi:adenosylcobinamide kinase/adenosylcobinamide-phosphate guanylyltransferase